MSDLEQVFAELDQLGERLEEVAFFSLTEYTNAKVEQLQEKLGIDYPPSSLPGQFPRKRTGKLQAGTYSTVMREGNSIDAFIYSTRPNGPAGVPGRLNFEMDRPYMSDTYEMLLKEFPVQIREIMRGKL